MAEAVAMGSVRPLAESVSVEEAERAAKRVREAIAQQEQQVDELRKFLDENKSLSELISKLPDAVSHRIMVPFGKAAFFPGRLVHTNEFMVFLGDNHYVERSSKQTIEILGRRGESLERQIVSAKDQIADLEAEASFVTATAEEAKAGFVEIREEYKESSEWEMDQDFTSRITVGAASSLPNSTSGVVRGSDFLDSTPSSSIVTEEDPEHDRMMRRVAELELAEAAAGSDDNESEEEGDDDSSVGAAWGFRSNLHRGMLSRTEDNPGEEDYDSGEMEEEDSSSRLGDFEEEEDYNHDDYVNSQEESEDDQGSDDRQLEVRDVQRYGSPQNKRLSRFASEVHSDKGSFAPQNVQPHVLLQQNQSTERNLRITANKEMSSETLGKPEVTGGFGDFHEEFQVWRKDTANKKGHGLNDRQADDINTERSSIPEHSRVQKLVGPAAAPLKAFTGTVKEHEYAAPTSSHNLQVGESPPSRPISKFKMRQAQGGR